MKSSPFI